MTILLRILGYGWLVLGTLAVLLVYYVLHSPRWPVADDVVGAALVLLPGFATVALAAALDRRNVRRLHRCERRAAQRC